MPTIPDVALAALFSVVWPLWTHFVEWPRHLKAVAAGDPTARLRLYRAWILQPWLLSAAVAALWAAFARPLDALGLRAPGGWQLALGVGLSAAYVVLAVAQLPAVARSAATRARLRARLESLKPLLPHRADEWGWFVPLSITAGICEELLFRGYLVWLLAPWIGLYGAAALSMVLFGFGHSYQGGGNGLKAFGAGVGLGLLALVTGSILPGMVLHALIDLGSGYTTYLAFREPEENPGGSPAIA